MPKVSSVFGLTPEQAVEFLRQKGKLVDKIAKQKLYDSALARATTISRLSSLEMTKDIYHSLERAVAEGKPLAQWKKELVAEFKRKGWVAGHDHKISRGVDGTLLADPKTGEYFGTPRRLNTIYRVNTQAAYAAGRYQRMMDNVDNRPYWQYSAVGDERTRPAHLSLNGLIYRYDDPFWTTFYPPNGFNCRCTVIALDERALARKGIEQVGRSDASLVPVTRVDRQDNKEQTTGFLLADGRKLITDKGFDYNVGRLSYKPNLDLYPEKLAHQFAKVEMTGAEFRWSYQQIEKAFTELKQAQGIEKKLTSDQMIAVRDNLTRNLKFAAGRLSQTDQSVLNVKTATVWLSDDTLIKQFNSREGQDFGLDEYALLPDLVFSADLVSLQVQDEKINKLFFYKKFEEKWYLVVIKEILNSNELFAESFRISDEKDIRKKLKKQKVVRDNR